MAKPGLPLAAAAGSSHAWRSRVALGDLGVLALAVLPLSGGLRIAAWVAVLAGVRHVPALVAAALARARWPGTGRPE